MKRRRGGGGEEGGGGRGGQLARRALVARTEEKPRVAKADNIETDPLIYLELGSSHCT